MSINQQKNRIEEDIEKLEYSQDEEDKEENIHYLDENLKEEAKTTKKVYVNPNNNEIKNRKLQNSSIKMSINLNTISKHDFKNESYKQVNIQSPSIYKEIKSIS